MRSYAVPYIYITSIAYVYINYNIYIYIMYIIRTCYTCINIIQFDASLVQSFRWKMDCCGAVHRFDDSRNPTAEGGHGFYGGQLQVN